MKLFNLDSPFMQFLTLVGNLMIVNLLTIFLCLPILTAGDAVTAMYYVTIKMVRGDDPYIVKSYFKSFKENFKQATIIWILMLLVTFILVTDCRIVFTGMAGSFATALKVVLGIVIAFAVITCVYIFPVLSRFENSIKYTIKNSFLMSILNLPRTVLIVVIHLLPVLLILVSNNMVPVVFLLGFSTVAYLCSTQYVKIFKKYEPEEEETVEESGDELAPLSFIVEEEKAKMEQIAAQEAAEKAALEAAEGQPAEEPAAEGQPAEEPAAGQPAEEQANADNTAGPDAGEE